MKVVIFAGGMGTRISEESQLEGGWNFDPDIKDCINVRQVLNEMNKYWGSIAWKDISAGDKVHEANPLRLNCSKALHHLGC